ncbi:MAG: LuxR C-terminal-related transcriptional regulator [Streptosporangiaceae bacterium]
MSGTASRPASPRLRPERLTQKRLAQQRRVLQRSRQQRLRRETGLGLPHALLEDKLRAPGLPPEVLHRHRLTDLLESAVARRVTVVSGPPGAGKTVACAAWASSRPPARQPAWLTVEAADRDPARFWPYLLAALVRARAVAPGDAAQLAGTPPEAFPRHIAAALARLADPAILIIDDVHELAGSTALNGLDLLIKHAPAGLRLVLAGRCPPGLALSRLRLAGEVADIGASDLACTPAEADDYLSMLGIDLTSGQRADLVCATEGWMAGLRLAAMSGPGKRDGRSPAVIDFVRAEVLRAASPRTRAFLLKTSVTASLSGALADALTGDGGTGARTLERLARENGFVQATVGGSGEYRYHPMLREVLAAELRRECPEEVPVLLGRLARWHAARGDELEAVRAAAQAGDWNFGSDVLVRAGPGVLAPDQPAELESVLAAFPPEQRAGTAPVAATLAAARLWQGDADGAAPYLDCAKRSLSNLDDEARGVVEPWLAALTVMGEAGQDGTGMEWVAGTDWVAGHWSLAEQVSAGAATVPLYRAAGLLWYAIGCGLLRRQDARRASVALARASSLLAAGSLPGLRARTLAWRALAVARCGELAAADRLIAEATDGGAADGGAADGGAGGRPEIACPVALARAQVCVARDELVCAAARLDEAGQLAAGQGAGEPSAAVLGGLIRVHCAAAESDPVAAESVIAAMRAGQDPADTELSGTLAVLEAGLALAAGEREHAGLILAGLCGPAAAWPAARLCRARLLLASGDDKGALEAIDSCLTGTDPDVTLRDRIGALLIAAVARRRLSQVIEATQAIEQALLLAEPEGAYRVFLDCGPAVRSAMTVLVAPTSRCAGFAGRVLERFDAQPPRPARGAGAPSGGLPLTSSELAVLRFLPSHMTNQEIAEALFLSINTVKTHLRSAYRKLGVASRRAAIARARRLDLL